MYRSRTTNIIRWAWPILMGIGAAFVQHYGGWLWWAAYIVIMVALTKPLVEWRFRCDYPEDR